MSGPPKTIGLVWLILAVVVGACTPPAGGLAPVRLEALKALAGLAHSRDLSELVPHPRPVEDGLELVTCRWPEARPVSIAWSLPAEERARARRLLAGWRSSLPGLPRLVEWEARGGDSSGILRIRSVPLDEEGGPRGVGDTLVRCEVGAQPGVLVDAEVRMRSVQRDLLEEPVAVSESEWSGALLHELGHAMGFAGHARRVESVLRREDHLLRRLGRRALAGKAFRDELLPALYALAPGTPLGRRDVSVATAAWMDAIEAGVAAGGEGPWSSVGDRHAALLWRDAGGGEWRLRFPYWARQLRQGEPVIGFPDAATRARLTPLDGRRRPSR